MLPTSLNAKVQEPRPRPVVSRAQTEVLSANNKARSASRQGRNGLRKTHLTPLKGMSTGSGEEVAASVVEVTKLTTVTQKKVLRRRESLRIEMAAKVVEVARGEATRNKGSRNRGRGSPF